MVWDTYLEKNCPSSNGHPWTSHGLVAIYVPLWCNMDGHKHNYKTKCISSCNSESLPILQAWVDTRHWICLQLELLHPIEELHFLIWQPSIRQKSIESLSSQHSGGRIGKKDVPAAAAITIFFFPASI